MKIYRKCKKLNLEIATEYLVMAAWIAFLKSRILLPEEEEQKLAQRKCQKL